MKNLIVFVCTGNTCRSPMAEYLARHHLGADSGWEVRSAGISTGYGMPASQQGIEVMEELGLDSRSHSSQPLSRELAENAALIVCMTRGHMQAVQAAYPEVMDRVRLLKSFSSGGEQGDVADPIGMPVEVYRETRDEIDAALRKMIPRLPEYTVD